MKHQIDWVEYDDEQDRFVIRTLNVQKEVEGKEGKGEDSVRKRKKKDYVKGEIFIRH